MVDRHILDIIGADGPLSRADIVMRSGLPRSTVTDTVGRLTKLGLVIEAVRQNPTGSRGGRPSNVVALAAVDGYLGVIRFAHSRFDAGVCKMAGEIASMHKSATLFKDVKSGVEAGVSLLEKALADVGLRLPDLTEVVVSMPTPVRREDAPEQMRSEADGITSGTPKLPDWVSADLRQKFESRLGLPVVIENDANLAVIGERHFGSAVELPTVILISFTDGVGSGIMIDGRLHRGRSGFAGEIGHTSVSDDGALCFCGGRGCLMTIVNPQFLVQMMKDVYEHCDSMTDVIDLAARGDQAASRALRDAGQLLGRALSSWTVLMNPDGIVVDGRLRTAATPLIAGIVDSLRASVPYDVVRDIKVVVGLLGDEAEYFGAIAVTRRRISARQLD